MILIPLAASAAIPALHRRFRAHTAWLTALVPLGLLAATASWLPLDPTWSRTESFDWVPELGVTLTLRADGLAVTFALLINGIGALVLLYSGGYLRDDPRLGRLCALLLLFLSAMLGVVLSDNVFVLFVFWELTSLASYLLIGFKHEERAGRDAARQALLVTAAGGLALLAGLVLLALAGVRSGLTPVQAARISSLATADLAGQPLVTPAVLLILLGAFSKSAQMPLHFWLPSAMAAPTPVSAYLHSATMVKAGVYLLARLNPVLGDTALWHVLLTTTGAVTMLGAAAMAAGKRDFKAILAYTTVSVLGTLTMLIGVGTELAIKAAVVYLVAHAAYKAALFLVAGGVEHATGTRDVHALGGLGRAMPLSATAGLLAALSMAGAPPLFGFLGKELLLKAKLDLDLLGVVLILVASLANVFLIAMALLAAVRPFFGRRTAAAQRAHEAPALMLAGPLVLAVAGLFVGIVPGAFDAALGSAMASAIAGHPVAMELKLWHGLNPVALTALAISAATLTGGFLLFLRLRTGFVHAAALVARLGRVGPARLYDVGLAGLLALAAWITRRTQTGSLRGYVRTILLVFIAVSLYPLVRRYPSAVEFGAAVRWQEVILAALALTGALAAAVSPSRLAAIALLGVTGLLVALLFAIFSAPDLAITQILIETLTVILLVFTFYRLPRFQRLRQRVARLYDAVTAVAAGAVLAGLVAASATVNLPATVSGELARLAKPAAHGRNIVNVILVDFRALDTLGEITVVAVAGLGVYALLTLGLRRRARRSES